MQNAAVHGSQIAVVVRDLEPVLDLYTHGFGLGPFETRELVTREASFGHGASPARLRIAKAPLGPCEMELIEVASGRPPHQEFLEEHGEGMNHLNLDKRTGDGYLDTMSALFARGVEPFWGYPFTSFCYVESAAIGGVTFEVMRGSGHAGKLGHNHLGLVVEDTERTIGFYSKKLGLGPFRTNVFPMKRAVYRDQRIEASFKASFADIGESELALIQVIEGDTPHSRFLAEHGEGMHHLTLRVPKLGDALDELRGEGITATWQCPEAATAHLGTSAIGGMVFAVSETAQG